jgi:hypothetical protein
MSNRNLQGKFRKKRRKDRINKDASSTEKPFNVGQEDQHPARGCEFSYKDESGCPS